MTTQQIRSAIPQLERRLEELKDLDVNSLTDEDHADVLTDLHRRIDDTLAHVFGHGRKIMTDTLLLGWTRRRWRFLRSAPRRLRFTRDGLS
jgi:hypothetical protein